LTSGGRTRILHGTNRRLVNSDYDKQRIDHGEADVYDGFGRSPRDASRVWPMNRADSQDAPVRASQRLSESVLACIPQAVIATDAAGKITLFSPGAENMLGYRAEDALGKSPLIFHDAAEVAARAVSLSHELGFPVAPGFEALVARTKARGKPDESEWTLVRADGSRLAVRLATAILRNAQGETEGCLGVATDITESKRITAELEESAKERGRQNELLTALLRTIPVGVFMVEAPSGKPLIANDAAMSLLGPDILSGEYCATYKLPDRIPYPREELPLSLGMQGLCSHVHDLLVVRPDGGERVLDVIGSPVMDSEGEVWASVVSLIDTGRRSHAAAEMSRLAYYDHLTGLPNRRLFHDRMQMAITVAKREKKRLALMLIDLDKFKPVNDNLGHSVGDLLLKAVASRMQDCLRASDTLARVGGDEFMVILPDIEKKGDALGVAEKIRLALNEPFDLDGRYRVSIACSVGIAIYPENGRDEKRLSKSADDAMYNAKEGGRNCVRIFNTRGESEQRAAGHDASLVRLVWHRSFKCGDPLIDHEHHELFERANALLGASFSEDADVSALRAALDDLIDFVGTHFRNEEAFLRRHGYAELDDHALKHQRLYGHALDLRSMAEHGELKPGDLVTYLAQDIVAKHLLVEDRKFFALLHDWGKVPGTPDR
jgi:diguanylate cyclase (GGDEF)-like protein/hemerythrin-like metal-binding protein